MYIYESMWILVGVVLGGGGVWWAVKSDGLMKVGHAVQDEDGAILLMTGNRDQALNFIDARERDGRAFDIVPVYVKAFGSDPGGQ